MARVLFEANQPVDDINELLFIASEVPGHVIVQIGDRKITLTPAEAQKAGTELINHSWPYSQRNRA